MDQSALLRRMTLHRQSVEFSATKNILGVNRANNFATTWIVAERVQIDPRETGNTERAGVAL